jgi:sugar phosphate isomerase/epimerase
MAERNNWPKLHNAMWPGVVGKGGDAEPPIELKKLIELTAAARVDGQKFDGVDLFLAEPHTSIDSTDDQIKALADEVGSKGLSIGSLVAPVWPPVGGGSAMGDKNERDRFIAAVDKACRIGRKLRDLGVRHYGVVRVDSATGVDDWAKDPKRNTEVIAETFRKACDVAEGHGEQLAAEGEICWGGMHGWKSMLRLLETVGRPKTLGFQADMAHTLLYTLGYNAEEERILPKDFDWKNKGVLASALKAMTKALRPWTVDFHVAQNDATVRGSGSHDKTGRHCTVDDPNGKLDIVHDAGYWLRDEAGALTKAFKHICWDGCMFPNETMTRQKTWNDILGVMVKVRDAHGWRQ